LLIDVNQRLAVGPLADQVIRPDLVVKGRHTRHRELRDERS
jgi:hypothetical protein